MQKNDNVDILKCTISHFEFKKIIKRKNDATVEAILDTLETLRISRIEIKTKNKWLRYGFINGSEYNEITKEFTIKADAEIYKLLFDYLKGYTPINLAIFFSFKNAYAQRFYEFLRLWSNSKNKINYTIEELKELLKLENQYNLYADFKKRVLVPAIKELNEKSLMNIEFIENKRGKKVYSIDFIVNDTDKRKYFENKNKDKYIYDNKKDNKANNLKFNNFDQREYDYDDLEKKLLGWSE